LCSGRDSPSHLHDVGGVRVVSRMGRDQAGWGGRGTGNALGCNAVESWGGGEYIKQKNVCHEATEKGIVGQRGDHILSSHRATTQKVK